MSTSVLRLCDRLREIGEREDQLYGLMGDVEVMLARNHAWLELTGTQRRALPAAKILYDTEDELDDLGRENADLVVALQLLPATSLAEAKAKLEVVARVLHPDDYPQAYAILSNTITEMAALL